MFSIYLNNKTGKDYATVRNIICEYLKGSKEFIDNDIIVSDIHEDLNIITICIPLSWVIFDDNATIELPYESSPEYDIKVSSIANKSKSDFTIRGDIDGISLTCLVNAMRKIKRLI